VEDVALGDAHMFETCQAEWGRPSGTLPRRSEGGLDGVVEADVGLAALEQYRSCLRISMDSLSETTVVWSCFDMLLRD